MVGSLADHLIGAGIFLLAFVVKDWAQTWPVVKFLWPRAWDERREHGRTDDSPDAEGLPGTDLARLQQAIPVVLAQIQRLQSSVSEGRKELLDLKKIVRDQKGRLCALEDALLLVDLRFPELETARENERAARRERDLLRARVARAFS